MGVTMKLFKFLAVTLFAFFVSTLTAAEEDLATQILSKYNGIQSFSAKYSRVFTQHSTGKKSNDSGEIFFLAPSDIRMDTFIEGKMTEQTFVDAEKTLFIYHSKKSALIKKSLNEASDYLAFLQGLDKVKQKFKISDSTATIEKAKKIGMVIKDKAKMIKLTPKAAMGNVRYIFITSIESEIESVIIVDQLKNINQFTFSDIKYNPKLEKAKFKAAIPQGFEVSEL